MLKNRYVPLILLSFFVIFASSVFAQGSGGTQTGAIGARAISMGGNYRALTNDWSAAFYNPAGLNQLSKKWNFGASISFFTPGVDYTPSPYNTHPFSGINTSSAINSEKKFYIPTGAVFYRVSNSLVLGVGIFTPFGLENEWNLITLPTSYGNNFTKTKEHSINHRVISIQPTVAYKISDNLSVGVGVSYIYGSMVSNYAKLSINPVVEHWSAMQARATLLGIDLKNLTNDQYRLAYNNHLDVSGSALGINLGLKIKITDDFSFGMSGRYYMDLDMKGAFKQTQISFSDPVKMQTLSGIPAEFYNFNNGISQEKNKNNMVNIFSGQDIDLVDDNNAKMNLPLPLTVGVGFSYYFHPRFVMTTDISWNNWAARDKVLINVDGEEFENILMNWENNIEGGLGFEWKIFEDESYQIFWRGGFHFVSSPIPDETLTPLFFDLSGKNIYTTGFGFKHSNITLNLSFLYASYKDKLFNNYSFNSSKGFANNWAGNYNLGSTLFSFDASLGL